MPSVAPSPEPQHTVQNKKSKTSLGRGNSVVTFKESDDTANTPGSTPTSQNKRGTFARKSVDAALSYSQRRKQRQDRSSVNEGDFFEPDAILIAATDENSNPIPTLENMKAADGNRSRRPPVRMDAQDGPWSVSVAETPNDARSYSLYIKTPTHNLTLTRTAVEVVELHHKLRDAHPNAKLPVLPIDVTALPTPTTKRKSTFLNTLSRLASPSSKTGRNGSRHASNASVSAVPSSPGNENTDPFAPSTSDDGDISAIATGTNTNSTITALAAYLTSISNEPTLRQARHWKRFVRVRTDDLESVRVERAIKRVRSDLTSHITPKSPLSLASKEAPSSITVQEPKVGATNDAGEVDLSASTGSLRGEGITEEDEGVGEAIPKNGDVDIASTTEASTLVESGPPSQVAEEVDSSTAEGAPESSPETQDEELSPATAVPAEVHASRIPRSQSADPDKMTRMTRVYTNQEGAASQTGDESSIASAAGDSAERKKRSRSSDPNRVGKKSQRKVVIDDFEMMRVLGKGCAGKVLLVRYKSTADLYALKAITKRHVLAHQELQHTLTEQAVLKRMAAESKDPFVVKLWWSFHDKENLFLVMDFHPGGDLATQLARWGRLGRDRARFYAAEIVEGVEGLHAAGVIYRDLKPENILIGGDGHIVLTDFGLSKEFPRRNAPATAPTTPSGTRGEFYSATPASVPATPPWMRTEKGQEAVSGWPGQAAGHSDTTSTFCGTAEYLAPEVIQGLPYSYEVDWWSFGTMLYEMLTGITPFWAGNHSDMYVRVLQDELTFPDDRAIDQDTKSLIRGLLQRNPALRMCEPRVKRHPYFSMIDWSHVYYKRYIPPYIPPIDPLNASDTQNFDDTFLDMEPVLDDPNENIETDTDQERDQTDTDRTDGEDSITTPSQSRSPSVVPVDDTVDVFDGYSFKGRHSILIDSDEGEQSDPEDVDDSSIAEVAQAETESVVESSSLEEVEPKTPEAHQNVLTTEPEPIVETTTTPTESSATEPSEHTVESTGLTPRTSVDKSAPVIEPEAEKAPEDVVVAPAAAVDAKRTKPKTSRHPGTRPAPKVAKARREKSGVTALDRDLSDTVDESGEITERDDDDWDFIEAADGEDRNGTQPGPSLFARGVVDRYRLAVFRKTSTPVPTGGRSFSTTSKASDLEGSVPTDSPSPSDKRRGRNSGLTFRKHPRQFLRPKSPSSKKPRGPSGSHAASTGSSPGLLSPAPSANSPLPPPTPSLKSKQSQVSVDNNSASSDQSPKPEGIADGSSAADTIKGSPASPVTVVDEPEKTKSRKLKIKYKENAEKVFSLFTSPRPPQPSTS